MAITGYEKSLNDYSKQELIEIAESYKIYYQTASGQGKISGYQRLTKEQLIKIIKSDADYINADPKKPRKLRGSRLTNKTNRLKNFKESLLGTESPEELMNEILSLLNSSERYSIIPGRYYTYVYYAVTPRIIYDRHPLIKAGDILPKGFRGFNYHLGRIRQYNSETGDRIVSGLYEVSGQEFEILKSIPYRKLVQN